jgi:hypothetical protein
MPAVALTYTAKLNGLIFQPKMLSFCVNVLIAPGYICTTAKSVLADEISVGARETHFRTFTVVGNSTRTRTAQKQEPLLRKEWPSGIGTETTQKWNDGSRRDEDNG